MNDIEREKLIKEIEELNRKIDEILKLSLDRSTRACVLQILNAH